MAILHVSTELKQLQCNIIIFCFVNGLFIFIPMFYLMLVLLKNNLNGNKINFGTAL